MIDIDHFKRFNDLRGHEAGDAVLSALGALLRTHVRAEDIACRYGGEEFTLILPETPSEVAQARVDELRKLVRQLAVESRDQAVGAVTFSAGVAAFPEDGDSGEALLRAADTALYRAKAEGRNRVVVASRLHAAVSGGR